jgi:hypothetical protein
MRGVLVALACLAGLLLAAGCSSTIDGTPVAAASPTRDRQLVEAYFTDLNASAADPATQRDFLRRSQHPDFTDELCDLGDLTLRVDPAMSTLRVDPDWVPPAAGRKATHPRGLVYVLGVSVSIRQGGALLGEQIGSERVVILDGRAYGFAPCPTG